MEIKKSVEAHNPIMPYLTKAKESVSSASVFSESTGFQTVLEDPPLQGQNIPQKALIDPVYHL